MNVDQGKNTLLPSPFPLPSNLLSSTILPVKVSTAFARLYFILHPGQSFMRQYILKESFQEICVTLSW